MRRRGFLKAMVAVAAGCLSIVPRVVLSTKAGTLKPGWTKGEQKAWGGGDSRISVELRNECMEPGCMPRAYSIERGNQTVRGYICQHQPFVNG